jgi:hypothetical protein
MRVLLFITLLALSVAHTGCGASDGEVATGNASGPPRPDVPEWHDRYKMPWELDPAQVTFSQPAAKEKLLRVDKAIRGIAGHDWFQRAGKQYPYLNWNSGTGGYCRTYRAQWKWSQSGAAGHSFSLHVTLWNKTRRAHGFTLYASHWEEHGWKVYLSYGYGGMPSFRVSFEHPVFVRPVNARGGSVRYYHWGPRHGSFWTTRSDKRYHYEFQVYSRDSSADDRRHQIQNAGEILGYLKSAGSFRKAAEGELDWLEKSIRAYFAKDQPAMVRTHGGPTGADPPRPASLKVLPEPIRWDALNEALQDIAIRRKLLADHYKPMYQAMAATFPPLFESPTDYIGTE